ncbi:MAG: hypothetical protein BJ554DRAFT_3725 [Olpidium bornovanus]|uniref:Uncharacterized protein n=1 Tax=Olpidium bornovanus TaxID=278681 RepID=A0A8H7ZP08_9FUNG|nr:MAG: hypothetical protein BJ554DRAFT_3725 [Olpidium bornovanus]
MHRVPAERVVSPVGLDGREDPLVRPAVRPPAVRDQRRPQAQRHGPGRVQGVQRPRRLQGDQRRRGRAGPGVEDHEDDAGPRDGNERA